MRLVDKVFAQDVPISMDEYSINGRNILSMDLKYPWVQCNIYNI